MVSVSLLMGCAKLSWRACKCIEPSALRLGAPYLISPFMGQPSLANWVRIWCFLPVFWQYAQQIIFPDGGVKFVTQIRFFAAGHLLHKTLRYIIAITLPKIMR